MFAKKVNFKKAYRKLAIPCVCILYNEFIKCDIFSV